MKDIFRGSKLSRKLMVGPVGLCGASFSAGHISYAGASRMALFTLLAITMVLSIAVNFSMAGLIRSLSTGWSKA